ncbi:uncharacterized protein [Aegilops tauschii subsp. strangulata]|uniref:uncharacterized protein n=1 Tax=Aegilops tauschii subsp. strangulata TaxID=200361 RepID=UPI001ABD3629
MPTQQLTTFQLLPPAHAHGDWRQYQYHHHHHHQDQQQQLACGGGGGGLWDPASVLDRRASPAAHPTLSSPSPLPAGVAALAKNVSAAPPAQAWPLPPGPGANDDDAKDDWVHHLPPLDMAGWGDPHAAAMQEPHPPPSSQDSTFLRWIIGGGDDEDDDSGGGARGGGDGGGRGGRGRGRRGGRGATPWGGFCKKMPRQQLTGGPCRSDTLSIRVYTRFRPFCNV